MTSQCIAQPKFFIFFFSSVDLSTQEIWNTLRDHRKKERNWEEEDEINDGVYLSWGWPRCFSRKNDVGNMFIKRRIRTHLPLAISFLTIFVCWCDGHSNLSSFLSRHMLFLTPKLIVLFYGETHSKKDKNEFSLVHHCSWWFMRSIFASTCNRRKYLFISIEWQPNSQYVWCYGQTRDGNRPTWTCRAWTFSSHSEKTRFYLFALVRKINERNERNAKCQTDVMVWKEQQQNISGE